MDIHLSPVVLVTMLLAGRVCGRLAESIDPASLNDRDRTYSHWSM
jgi:hypothetical protein